MLDWMAEFGIWDLGSHRTIKLIFVGYSPDSTCFDPGADGRGLAGNSDLVFFSVKWQTYTGSNDNRVLFIAQSVEYLFRTTYERSDEMTINALLNYLNAAMPVDKYEDFDVQEVAKAVKSLSDKGKLVLEGDSVRPAK